MATAYSPLRRIRKGTTVIEYLGDRVSHEQADARYEDKDPKDNHTFLFTVDAKTVIDAGVNGNEARYINHGCDPNCESDHVNKRIFIEAIRTIQPGEELAYDYQIQRDSDDAPTMSTRSSPAAAARRSCRGSMLEPPRSAPRKKRSRAEAEAGKKPEPRSEARRAPRRRRGKRSPARPARRADAERRARSIASEGAARRRHRGSGSISCRARSCAR